MLKRQNGSGTTEGSQKVKRSFIPWGLRVLKAFSFEMRLIQACFKRIAKQLPTENYFNLNFIVYLRIQS